MAETLESLDAAVAHHHRDGLARTGTLCRQILRIDSAPDSVAVAHSKQGKLLRQRGLFCQALAEFRQARKLNPGDADTHYHLGLTYRDLGETVDEITCYERALEISPGYVEACNNLGVALQKVGRDDEAIERLRQAVRLRPESAWVHYNLGLALREQGRLIEAVDSYQQAIERDPEFHEAHNNLGAAYQDLRKLGEAFDCFQAAIHIQPDFVDARFNIALIDLLRGNWDAGWNGYESRWMVDNEVREFSQPVWDGTPLAGRRILVYGEQGVGDEILFASCLPEVIEQAGHCVVECDRRLVPLFERSFARAHVIARSEHGRPPDPAATECDVQSAAGSLPRYLRRTIADFPARQSYLKADKSRCRYWADRVAELGSGRTVGIAWRGGKLAYVRRQRSTTLDQWSPLWTVDGVQFVNLQYGNCRNELATLDRDCAVTVHNFDDADPLTNLDDFAALLGAVDLVISIDSATVHLAGALGTPVWTLLPLAADWRWMQERDDSPWYRSMRLFRKAACGRWEDLFQQVARELKRWSAEQNRTNKQQNAAG